jgi:hypothetical protein
MWKKHPNYRSAKQNLNTIFALIKQWKHFPTPQSLADALKDKYIKYSTVYLTVKLFFKEQIWFCQVRLRIGKIILWNCVNC